MPSTTRIIPPNEDITIESTDGGFVVSSVDFNEEEVLRSLLHSGSRITMSTGGDGTAFQWAPSFTEPFSTRDIAGEYAEAKNIFNRYSPEMVTRLVQGELYVPHTDHDCVRMVSFIRKCISNRNIYNEIFHTTHPSKFKSFLVNMRRNMLIGSPDTKHEMLISFIKKNNREWNNLKVGSIVISDRSSGYGRLYEVVGFRDDKVLVAPTGLQRRGNVTTRDRRTLIVVGSPWPKEPVLYPVDTDTIEFSKDSDFKKKFYDEYQIGVEIEGEFFLSPSELFEDGYPRGIGDVVGDGSIYPQNDGHLFEINSSLIHCKDIENDFIASLRGMSRKGKDTSPFAMSNNTAGTHVHLDINRGRALSFLSKYGLPSTIPYSFYLRFLDSMEFEKFFFGEYFKYFKMKKFWERLSNNYCRAFIKRSGLVAMGEDTKPEEVECDKLSLGKYKWLNFQSLKQKMGIEFRIFPYLTTAKGVQNVIDFTQYVVMKYMEQYATREKLMVIHNVLGENISLSAEIANSMASEYFGRGYVDMGSISYDAMVLIDAKKKLEKEKNHHV